MGRTRLARLGVLVAAVAGWWISDHAISPWIQQVAGYDRIQGRDLSVLLGHWVFGQLPRVAVCVTVWLVAARWELMPSLGGSLASGGSWRRVVRAGLVASVALLALTMAIGAAAGGTFGFHPYVTKMLGDVASNMYEEIVYRGLMFGAFYGVAAGVSFPLAGRTSVAGLVAGTIGSSVLFGLGHEQYSAALRVVIALTSTLFVYPWVASRSLWAPWIAHMVVDVVGDSVLEL